MMPTDRTGYENVVQALVEENPTAVEADPSAVASSVIAGVDRRVDPANGYVRTHGTEEFLGVTLYPTDVVANSEQEQTRVDDHYAETHSGTVHDAPTEIYAIHTMALDLIDAHREVSDR